MSNLKKLIILTMITLVSMSGCTQIVTAPISIAGSVASSAASIVIPG